MKLKIIKIETEGGFSYITENDQDYGSYNVVEQEVDIDLFNRGFYNLNENFQLILNEEGVALYKNSTELNQLLEWFNNSESGYDVLIKKYQRHIRMGTDRTKDIESLDKQADKNAKRISELRKLLNI